MPNSRNEEDIDCNEHSHSMDNGFVALDIENVLDPPITKALGSTLRVLQIFGFFTQPVPSSRARPEIKKPLLWSILSASIFLKSLLLLYLAINMYIFVIGCTGFWQFKGAYGFMHVLCIGNGITMLKPAINIMGLGIFFLCRNRHIFMLYKLDCVNNGSRYSCCKRYLSILNVYMIASCLLVGVTIALKRSIEYVLMEEVFGDDLISDCSLAFAPMLTIWNLIPLIYYLQIQGLIRHSIRHLIKDIKNVRSWNSSRCVFTHKELTIQHFYGRFMEITHLQRAVANFFNPFLAFSLFWSLLSLCVTIYIGSQIGEQNVSPILPLASEDSYFWNLLVITIFGWILVQIIVATLHVILLFDSGGRTNHLTRMIQAALLGTFVDHVPNPEQLAYFQLFSARMNTQFGWGASCWRAFALERGTFLSMVTATISYSFIIIKFKPKAYNANEVVAAFNTFLNDTKLFNGSFLMLNLTTTPTPPALTTVLNN